MAFDEFLTDAKLNIDTIGRDESCANTQIMPYEPTPYSVLERLCESGLITGKNHAVDYGSGKGRAAIFLYDKCGCKVTGIELVRKFYESAKNNLKAYAGEKDVPIEFINTKAQDYDLSDTADTLFFFNPFHFKTLKRVMKHVVESYEREKRLIRIFVYYPQNAYIAYLSSIPEVMFNDEIDCTDLFPEEDDRNRIMIFEIGQDI